MKPKGINRVLSVSLPIILVLCLFLVACGADNNDNSTTLHDTLQTPSVKDGVTTEGEESILVLFEWNEIDGADGYEVCEESKYRTEETYREPEYSETTELSFTSSTQDYFDFRIKVRAYKGEGDKRAYSDWSEYSYGSAYDEEPLSVEDADIEDGGDEMGEAAKLLYQGHASVRILTPEGKTIYVDPFAGEGYDAPADLILITHGHYDHTQTDMITTKNNGCKTITWEDALSDGKHQSFDLGYVKVEAVEAGYNKNHDVKECVGYILTFSNGVTVYLSGDTSTTPQMAELASRNLDYAFICCDGVYNMDVTEAMECAKTIGAKHTIPYHMIPADKTNCFEQSVADSFDVPGRIIVKPGEELVLGGE